jgi:hypothetical protein
MKVSSVLTLAGEFREINKFARTTNPITGEVVYTFEGALGTTQTKKWEVPTQHVIGLSYASEKSNVSSTNEQKIPETFQGKEYFVFGKCTGLALDGSLGLGDYKDKKSFDEYVKWYNDTKLTNSKWTSMSASGEIYNPPAPKQDAVEVKSLFGTPSEPEDDLPF